ncbi:MAG: putative DNA binding domain-containing protein [bacterium]|nr:putative DNA binding domain-containing protein [bacterium]
MKIPSNEEILELLDCLDQGQTADDLESEVLDFKPWSGNKTSRQEATEYSVCFSNTEGGVVVFGVKDRVVTRSKAIEGVKDVNFDDWKTQIYQSTQPNITVCIEELKVPEGTGKILVVRIPKGTNPPYGTMSGIYKRRVGKSCMAISPTDLMNIQVSSGAIDWSGSPATGADFSVLNAIEIQRARNILFSKRPESGLLQLDDRTFLIGLGAIRNGKVTNTGLLFFGNQEILATLYPQHQIHYVYQTSETDVARNESRKSTLLTILEFIEQVFLSPVNPEYEVTLGLFKLRIPSYPIEVVREAVLNAITHRDYLNPNEILIRHTNKELVITSPGGFLGGITPQNILRHEPISRNRTLAEAFEKLGLVERAGIGLRRIFTNLLSYGKRIPIWETDGTQVTLRIANGTYDERMAKLVSKWKEQSHEIELDTLLLLNYLKVNTFIFASTASELLQLHQDQVRSILDQLSLPAVGILEKRGKTKAATYYLSKAIAVDLLGKSAYSMIRGIAPSRYLEMIKQYLSDHDYIKPRECRELLGLGESQSARVETSKLLRIWANKDGFLSVEGKGPSRKYYLRQLK